MDIRAQVSMVFHLDKCLGCHTCSIACKNIWTDRSGSEYMWWNNVETKPGSGYPVSWENQDFYRGGWETKKKSLRLRSQNKGAALTNLFYNPNQPGLDDYYEPWTYTYKTLADAPADKDQPTAIPVSQITGNPIDLKRGPNWDDDLSGSSVYAWNDPNFSGLSDAEKSALFEVERVAFFYLPRICNHCVNPACVGACPSGALYKRGEDGIVLVNQEVCRGWRACVAACPYKKVYYNWQSSKSEKCILCYPRIESGQASACFHSCVGRIRYQGVLLYDADKLGEIMMAPEQNLVEAQKQLICDPLDPAVREAGLRNGISPEILDSAIGSPVYRFVKEWNLALPLHVEFRTFPMLFYVPPLLPVAGQYLKNNAWSAAAEMLTDEGIFSRLPLQYLSRLFGAGNPDPVVGSLRKLIAVRAFVRSKEIHDISAAKVADMLRTAGLTPESADDIYKLTTIADRRTRYALPPLRREEAISSTAEPESYRGTVGLSIPPGPRKPI